MALIRPIPSNNGSMELIATQTITTATATNVALSESISKFTCLVFSFVAYDGAPTLNNPVLGFTPSDEFTTITGHYGIGTPAYEHTTTITKVDDTNITIQNDYADNRTLYVYGIN